MRDWIVTYTGRKVRPHDLRPDDVCVQDIAHHLAIMNRFLGATSVPYSVAEHSVRVSWLCSPENALWGLLHDASEAYLSDVSRPVKRLPEFAVYRELEAGAMRSVCEAFGLPPDEPPEVKWADNVITAAERRDLTAFITEDDGLTGQYLGEANVRISTLQPWGWETAKARFLDYFAWLVHRR